MEEKIKDDKCNIIDDLRGCNDEKEIERILADISDYIRNRCYSFVQIKEILYVIGKYDLLSLNYSTREQVLYTICEITECYQIKETNIVTSLMSIREYLEPDLKAYVDEILS